MRLPRNSRERASERARRRPLCGSENFFLTRCRPRRNFALGCDVVLFSVHHEIRLLVPLEEGVDDRREDMQELGKLGA